MFEKILTIFRYFYGYTEYTNLIYVETHTF